VWFLGIEVCAVGLNHDPNPLALGRPLPGAAEFLLGLVWSSGPVCIVGMGESIVVANPAGALLVFGTIVTGTGVPVLTPGVAIAVELLTAVLANPFCIIDLISLSCSSISLSPASSLIPGSR
jgi:hypothetical protein